MADADVNRRTVVLDSGTGSIKVGYAGANFPTAVVPTVLGRPVLRAGATKVKDANGAEAAELKDLMLGDEVRAVRHLLHITTPVRNGVVKNRDDMCLLWDHAFSSQMKIDPREHTLSLSEAPITSDRAREELFQIMFEKFGFQAIQATAQGVLALYAAGVTTGVAVDSGEGVTHCTPIYDGYAIKKANRQVGIGGNDVTENLVRLMQRRGYSFHSSADFELMRAVKEKFCYAAVNFSEEQRLSDATTVLEKSFVLPDNTTCTIGKERFEATEVLFQPGRMGVESDGLSTQIWNSIQASDMDVRGALFENVILAGGSSMFPGLPSRIERDMQETFVSKSLGGDRSKLHRFKLKIHDAPRRKHMTFLGGACYSQLTAESPEMWLSREQYDEDGPSSVTRMFASM
uniref:Actin-related protein 2 n=1 Tax=Neobodo designis TaxID=312471 RepID=A0A7S1MSF0_NEODS